MVYLGGALGVNTYLMYGFFNTVPSSIDEAAKIDGASHAQIFFGIILRLVAPILAVVGLLSFIGIHQRIRDRERRAAADRTARRWPSGCTPVRAQQTSRTGAVFAAGAVIAAIPVMALFLFLQRYIVGGLTAGSVKG